MKRFFNVMLMVILATQAAFVFAPHGHGMAVIAPRAQPAPSYSSILCGRRSCTRRVVRQIPPRYIASTTAAAFAGAMAVGYGTARNALMSVVNLGVMMGSCHAADLEDAARDRYARESLREASGYDADDYSSEDLD